MRDRKEQYLEFLKSKIKIAPETGFEIDLDLIEFNDGTVLKPHQRDAVVWAVKGGCRALFESFGLGKTIQQLLILQEILKHEQGKGLIICPLGVRQEFTNDAKNKLGIDIQYVKNLAECKNAKDNSILITNYERVRDGDIDPNYFKAVSLDEASVLRSYGSKTYQQFLNKFQQVKYKFVATATPSPNKFKELIHYAGFLGIMDTGQALTRFFKRDSTKANQLTLYSHKEKEFWFWMSTWALFLTKPSDLGYDDSGYDLPEMEIIYHKIEVDHSTAGADQDGQFKLFRDAALGLKDASKEKRDSRNVRIDKAVEILKESPDDNFLLWHDLENERHIIRKAWPQAVEVYGSQKWEIREKNIEDFSKGNIQYLATKKSISGQGCNFQYHCHKAIFIGIDYRFNDFIQAVHRVFRFLQDKKVEIHIIYMESESEIMKKLLEKWKQHEKLVKQMTDIIKENGLGTIDVEKKLKRFIQFDTKTEAGKNWKAVNNDCIFECLQMPANSVDLIVTSIPFSNHYEYTPTYNDFGHTESDDNFFDQMDYLTPELLRILNPGRVAAIHVKDRILFGNATKLGMPTVNPFHMKTAFHFLKHGFVYMGMITIETDVVRENNQTYRLGWSEQCKDGSKMGVGSPEYLLLFRKLPTDLSTAYADTPVVKSKNKDGFKCPECGIVRDIEYFKAQETFINEDKERMFCPKCESYFNENALLQADEYSRGQWQIDARAKWNSSGNRFLASDEIASLPMDVINKHYTNYAKDNVYNYDRHIEIAKYLEVSGRLPATFQTLNIPSRFEYVWHNINRMRTLNGEQSRKNLAMHICPLQFDIVDRVINRYSNKGDTVFDPFAGLMTVPYRALKVGRKGIGVELNVESFRDGIRYLKSMEQNVESTTLFDVFDEFAEKEVSNESE